MPLEGQASYAWVKRLTERREKNVVLWIVLIVCFVLVMFFFGDCDLQAVVSHVPLHRKAPILKETQPQGSKRKK